MRTKPKRRKQDDFKNIEKSMPKEGKTMAESKAANIFLTIVFLICLIIAIYSGGKIIEWHLNNKENEEIIESISSKVSVETLTDEKSKYNIDFDGLKKINKDTIGWIKVYGTKVEFPVVQSSDNEYYLTHNFENKTNAAGWAFADYRNKFDGTDKNIIIYGHNRRDGSMFATLKNILSPEWYTNDENRIVVFITEDSYSLYEVYSVYEIEEEEYYILTDFNVVSYSDFIKRSISKSIYNFGINVTEDDKILTLSTCANNSKYRIVLQAKKISE